MTHWFVKAFISNRKFNLFICMCIYVIIHTLDFVVKSLVSTADYQRFRDLMIVMTVILLILLFMYYLGYRFLGGSKISNSKIRKVFCFVGWHYDSRDPQPTDTYYLCCYCGLKQDFLYTKQPNLESKITTPE